MDGKYQLLGDFTVVSDKEIRLIKDNAVISFAIESGAVSAEIGGGN